MNFPQSKKFKFEIDGVYTVTPSTAGRPDLIAYDLFNSVTYYRAICELNAIRLPCSVRFGIRPESELLNNDNITIEEEDMWENYFNNIRGVIDELKPGDKIFIPTLDSANEYLKRFGK